MQQQQEKKPSSNANEQNNNSYFLFETKPDRYGIAFNSRPPWDVALKYARAAWPKISGNDITKIAVLSGVAPSALEHARIEEQQHEQLQERKKSSGSALEIGVKLVERMFAQNLYPKGEVIA